MNPKDCNPTGWPIATDPPRVHCWHNTGTSHTLGMHPTIHDVRCCQCAKQGYRQDILIPQDGHGPHAPKQIKQGEVQIT